MGSIMYAAILIGLLGFSNSFSVFESDQETDGNTIIMNAAPRNEPMDAPKQPMKCYKCNSDEEGACSDEEYGVEHECVEGYGCLISKETTPGTEKLFFLRDCLIMSVDEYMCQKILSEEGTTLETCACSTELCNKNWADAGERPDDPTDAPTEPADKTVKCYSCDSNSGECDDEHIGTEMDCPVEYGCNIMTNNENLYTRGCSVTEEPGCTDDTLTHQCNCKTALCNKNWDTAGAEKIIKCYSCDSHMGECDETHAGDEIDCSVEAGCSISTDISDGKGGFVRGCSGELGAQGCINEDNATTCFCLEPLCNFDWSTAGSTTANSDTTKPTEPGPTIKCFECDSSGEGQCTDEIPGQEKECLPGHGCMITLETKVGEVDVLIRDCSGEYGNAEFNCNTINGEDGTIKTCNCKTPLCNRNWEEAAPGAAMKMSPALSVALGVVVAMLSIL